MNEQNYITATCSIKSEKVCINNAVEFVDTETSLANDFLKSVYKHYQLSYPKFYKMDRLSKLGFLASELLLKANKISTNYKPEDIAIIVANSASSLDIDTEHQLTISDKNNYFPSPALFVYTLPNILIGEIAIRNNFKGENCFFISDAFDSRFMSTYINSILNSNKAQCCVAGWVNFYLNDCEAFLYTVEKKPNGLNMKHTEENLRELYFN